VVLTTCDADTYFHNNHFAYLTHAFLCDGEVCVCVCVCYTHTHTQGCKPDTSSLRPHTLVA
jgi:hypothetical protein